MRQALLVVDMQNDYFSGGKMELVGIEQAAKKAEQALELCRIKNLPIMHIQHISNREGATFFLPNTDGVLIHKDLTPKSGEQVVQKHLPNSFRETLLHEYLQQEDIQELIICGAMTHMCIDTTVRAAFDLGYSCIVLSDACATRDMEFGGMSIKASQVHAAFMAALSSPFAKVISTSDLDGVSA